ncbi:hypothetical protein NIES25_10790 [Nostoc linckia NIES-25]|nr:hypothetical protein NIES25_10790 [Nostoc linckia NIES-25]
MSGAGAESRIDFLQSIAFCTFVGKGIHLYWGKRKYQTFPPFPGFSKESNNKY